MTVPTQLTLLRMILAGFVVALMAMPGVAAKLTALIVFLIAGGTDWLDGYIARRRSQTSPLGALLDPIADKVLVLGVLGALVWAGLAAWWLLALIVLREAAVTLVRLAAASRRVVLSATPEGKHKTVWQMSALGLLLFALALRDAPEGWRPAEEWSARLGTVCLWIATALTVASGVTFFWRHRAVLRRLKRP